MEETTTNQSQNNSTKLEKIPNSTGVLVLGILSIIFSCTAILGLTLAIIALFMSAQGKQLYFENSSKYDAKSYKNLKAGRVCAIIGTVFSGLYLLFFLFLIIGVALSGVALSGFALGGFPWEFINF